MINFFIVPTPAEAEQLGVKEVNSAFQRFCFERISQKSPSKRVLGRMNLKPSGSEQARASLVPLTQHVPVLHYNINLYYNALSKKAL